uniref:BCL2-associated athanogene 6 n=1 Tax=Hucho hucho TaxID=62062 RepID=A0A4W5Q0K5_9TELE
MEESASTIEVTVKTLDSQSRSYTVRGQLTVKEFKEHIAASVDISVDKQRLIYQGRVLQDERTLNEYNVVGKVIHLVERAPPQTSQSGGGGGGVSSGGTEGGATTTFSQGGPQDRNGNSYVMLGTFNLPVNIMDSQQIHMQVQQMMAGVGEAGRNTRVSTSTGRNGSVDMHINIDQSVQSEPRMRLQLAENLLRETQSLLHRLEGLPSDVPSQAEPETSQSTSSSSTAATEGAAHPMDTSPPAPPPPPPTSSTQTEGPPHSGPNYPSPVELVEVLSEVRRVEERLCPFIERTHSILGAATSADYNNNTQEREEDQQVLNLVGEALRLLGNSLVALSDLRCNLATPPPRHLHLVRPMSHYGSPVLLQGGMPHHVPRNLGTTVTMTSNGRQAAEGQAQPSQAPGPPESQALPPQPNAANQQPGQGQGAPHVIRITHQTMEPVVMMQMNLDDSGSGPQVQGQPIPMGTGQPGATPVHIPDLPPEFMQAIVHQISQQAAAMATATGHPGQPEAGVPGTTPSSDPSAPPRPLPPGARVVVTCPSFSPHIPQPVGTNINLRASVPPTGEQHSLQVREGDADLEKSMRKDFGLGVQPCSYTLIQLISSSRAHLCVTQYPDLFTGIVQGVPSTMMGSLGVPRGNRESIAQFIQRLSQTTNLFTPGSGDAVGFFGDLLSLVCQSFSMVDMVLLLHGNAQPLSRIQPQLTDFFNQHYLQGPEPTDANINAASEDLLNGLEEYIMESFATVTVREGVDIIQTDISFLRQQFTRVATHILRCTDHTFGPRLLLLCTQGLFECLALNLYCLRGEQRALTQVLNHRIRRMSAEVNPSLVNWLTSMMSMRLHVILEHNPVTEDHIQHYVIHTQRAEPEAQMDKGLSPAPATTAGEAMVSSGDRQEVGASPRTGRAVAMAAGRREESVGDVEPWAAAVPPEWVPIIRHDMLSQRKMKAQPPLSDAYLHGMPAKRRKVSCGAGPQLSLSEAVSRAARAAGVIPVTSPDSLQGELKEPELQEAYQEQVRSDIKERVRDDKDFSSQCFPNTHRAFSLDDS